MKTITSVTFGAVFGSLILGLQPALGQPLQPEVLYAFPMGDVESSRLVQGSDGSFYGTTAFGGKLDNGTVCRITTNGVSTTTVPFWPRMSRTVLVSGQ